MKKRAQSISNPDELNKHLQYTSPITWIVLGLSVLTIAAFFVWSSIYKIKIKISGDARIKDGQVVLNITDANKEKLAVGQKIYISEQEGSIVSLENSEPIVSSFNLEDGEYTYTIVLKEIRPIDFLFDKKS